MRLCSPSPRPPTLRRRKELRSNLPTTWSLFLTQLDSPVVGLQRLLQPVLPEEPVGGAAQARRLHLRGPELVAQPGHEHVALEAAALGALAAAAGASLTGRGKGGSSRLELNYRT